MIHLSLLLFALFSTLVVPSFSHSCGLGLKSAAVDNGEATNLHNIYRNMLNQGLVPNQPRAKHLNNLQFDNALAHQALKIARTCKYGHVNVSDPRWDHVGQNIYRSCVTFPASIKKGYSDAVKAWYDEHKDYKYSAIVGHKAGPKILHYTQLVWQNTRNVGCAYAQWQEMKDDRRWTCKYIVCNYGPAGNIIGEKPYEVAA